MRRRIWLRVTCAQCGSVRVLREHVVLCITMDESTYAFTCPLCRMVTERAAGPVVLGCLLNTIVFDQPPITELDVAEFAEALNATTNPLAELEG